MIKTIHVKMSIRQVMLILYPLTIKLCLNQITSVNLMSKAGSLIAENVAMRVKVCSRVE